MAKVYYEVDYSECEDLENAIKNFAGDAEKVINEYLQDQGNVVVSENITNYLPVSVNPSKKRRGKHAKYSKWEEITNPNLGISISNSLAGTRATHSFYYLYYVATSTGTSDPAKKKTGVGGVDFMTKGGEVALPIIQSELLDILENKIKEELK